jgi:small subunit ribosomal protein S19
MDKKIKNRKRIFETQSSEIRGDFSIRNKSLEELKELSLPGLSEVLNARARRKIKRGFTGLQIKFLRKLNDREVIKTHLRDMIFLPSMVGKTIQVHNGKIFKAVKVRPEMIGKYFGEFSLTRVLVKYTSKKDQGNKKKK